MIIPIPLHMEGVCEGYNYALGLEASGGMVRGRASALLYRGRDREVWGGVGEDCQISKYQVVPRISFKRAIRTGKSFLIIA
jgi:hypothetical protein